MTSICASFFVSPARYKPAPFFILDEVDAALDNRNISAIAAYVGKQARHAFQCVVVTHKEGFYSEADALIGVRKGKTPLQFRL